MKKIEQKNFKGYFCCCKFANKHIEKLQSYEHLYVLKYTKDKTKTTTRTEITKQKKKNKNKTTTTIVRFKNNILFILVVTFNNTYRVLNRMNKYKHIPKSICNSFIL